ncbi:vesicular-fusion protein S17 [Malassezia vespertilionis]|uniref:Sec17p n=1 Tax=Malassezia vespertilionis TaxID=2020962 RepID=A0A2N1JEC4_9BASI|nr:vesicular-fusion protein S17 [Malassezia vespertilionis]PKI84900.1 Sec17p [Malassezia vespertilionis]WFD06122.1 vesicular-fusion protein S17 [Malassezia vespertilionis]
MSSTSADALLQSAEKKASKNGGWFSSTQSIHEEAVELFKEAANKFRVENRMSEAGQALVRAADMEVMLNEKDFAANTYYEASKCFRMNRPDQALMALDRCAEILVQRGRFRQAADRKKNMAELYREDPSRFGQGLIAYEQAATWYMQEGANATASACQREAAQLAIQLEQYPKAIEMWEQVATASLGSNLTKYSVKDYFLNAGLCYLAIPDTAAAARAMSFYAEQDSGFPSTTEGQFLHAILQTSEHGELETFDRRVQEFDRMKPITGWRATLLQNVRKAVADEPDLS